MSIFSKQLLLASSESGTIEYTTPGTYHFLLKSPVRADIAIVGAGCPCERYRSTAVGTTPFCYTGDGASAFVGRVILPKGYYTVVVGNAWNTGYQVETTGDWTTYRDWAYAEDSVLSNDHGELIRAGTTRYSSLNYLSYSYNLVTIDNDLQIISTTINSSGNKGEVSTDIFHPITTTGYKGGASLYQGRGKGADSFETNFTKGYFKITYK